MKSTRYAAIAKANKRLSKHESKKDNRKPVVAEKKKMLKGFAIIYNAKLGARFGKVGLYPE